ncbi:MAG: trypsin-like peptidase domain-containing protein, partial [Isosphaeraceae bacterium]|nr:trypsin-like peptidase domain-containing protein [Isosphaeraceae bacterium]
MSTPTWGTLGPAAPRRRRLLAQAQGRALDEAYFHRGIRKDLVAEAADAAPDALVTPEMLAQLRELIAAKAVTGAGVRAAGPELFLSTETVVIVPGFLASALGDTAVGGLGLIWIDPFAAISDRLGALQLGPYDGKEADLDPTTRIAAIGALPIFYDLLRLALEVRRYTTEIFAFDWRKDLDLAASRLAARLRVLGEGPRPVHLVAHSQGALVARRALQQIGPEAARRIVHHLVLLGPASFGSFSAALALAGCHSLIRMLRRLAVEPPQGFQRVLASMTGLYQLLPWDAARVPWLTDHDPGRAPFWPVPIDAERLSRFFGWGRAIDTRFFDDRTTIILGDNHGAPTVGGLERHGTGLIESSAHALPGDGTVPHACAVLPGTRTFLAPGTEHSMLAADRGVISAVLDILADRPVALEPVSSDPADHVPAPSSWRETATPPTIVLQAAPPAPRREPPELNGVFLASYEDPPADSELLCLERRDRMRARREQRTLQAMTDPGAGPPNLELILDESNLLPFDFLRTGDRLGRAVVKLQRGDGAAGTGFLVAPDILLTNHHVLPDSATAAATLAYANYEADPPADPAGRPAVVPLDPEALFVTNADLDFTFCAVAGLDHLGVVPLHRDGLDIARSEKVNIIQHPRGRPKELALQDNQVVKADHVVVRYSCDTEPGSSGSPVFNNRWRLVALHHASVATDEPGARRSPSGDPSLRYLNEGVRLSAIALWLETAEANPPEQREQVARLRAIFGGLNPQVGFFGALGHRAGGRSAAQVVAESYRGGVDDDLDLGFWDLHGSGGPLRDHLTEVGWVLADMGLDIWCLAHVGGDGARWLCDYLETNFQLEYACLVDESPARPPLAVLYRRSRGLAVERLAWGADSPLGPEAPARFLVRLATRRGEPAHVHLVPLVRPAPGVEDRGAPALRALVETIGRKARRPEPEVDWVLIGAAARLAPEDMNAVGGLTLRAATASDDGAIAVLTGARSRIGPIFISPNQAPTAALPDGPSIADDRDLPRSAHLPGCPQPIALRLILEGPRPE